MKYDIKQVNYEGIQSDNGVWWVCNEICDRCGCIMRDYSMLVSVEPTNIEPSLCSTCIRQLIDSGISYEEFKREV